MEKVTASDVRTGARPAEEAQERWLQEGGRFWFPELVWGLATRFVPSSVFVRLRGFDSSRWRSTDSEQASALGGNSPLRQRGRWANAGHAPSSALRYVPPNGGDFYNGRTHVVALLCIDLSLDVIKIPFDAFSSLGPWRDLNQFGAMLWTPSEVALEPSLDEGRTRVTSGSEAMRWSHRARPGSLTSTDFRYPNPNARPTLSCKYLLHLRLPSRLSSLASLSVDSNHHEKANSMQAECNKSFTFTTDRSPSPNYHSELGCNVFRPIHPPPIKTCYREGKNGTGEETMRRIRALTRFGAAFAGVS